MKEQTIEALVGGPRFLKLGNYRFDRLIFGAFVLAMLALFVFAFVSAGSDRAYKISYHCAQYCMNPFYENYPTCTQVWPGACTQEYVNGPFDWNPAPWIVRAWTGILISMFLLALVVNHFLHNRGVRHG